ncbi:MAG: hypothetical protein V4499_03840 [Pseudomonadota bacterium]
MRKLLQNGAGILFALSVVVFVGTLIYSLVMLNGLQQASVAGSYQGPLPAPWLSVLAAFSGALSAAAVPFLGACLIDRVDQYLDRRVAGQ